MFLQVHTLTSYHATLLNRDDAGLAKRIPFGGADRLRISSQCLKRHWRQELQRTLPLPSGIRSRQFFSRTVLEGLTESGVAEDLARKLVRALVEKTIVGGFEDGDSLALKQPVLFGRPEADFFVSLLAECAAGGSEKAALEALKEKLTTDKKNFRAMLQAAGHGNLFAGVEGALFGRFVTSDILARSDAAVHVAHAFTVHGLATEVDYFTVVDDLNREGETGAAHAGDMELGAGIYYGYAAVDVPLLVSNFHGCPREQWRDTDSGDVPGVLTELVRTIATTSPGAKLGATAPYAYSDLVLLEAGPQQPRSLANAYLDPLPMRGDTMQAAAQRLARHLGELDTMYGRTAELRAVATTREWEGEPRPMPLPEATKTALAAIFGG